ncbi:MerR family transcriptional regulator [Kribbella deserti]|uniref:MerR family transcriptional regulator n=1 Tax=Kribbella deserti TaxID=1926257 RepID=A0ABV6QMB9_9ACTN
MAWSIAEVARESGVTSRTLRHYDAIGLLSPAWTSSSGRRYYGQDELYRLQRILLLRELGLGLEAIADVLERQNASSTIAVLVKHRNWLVEEQGRLGRLVQTVDSTIDSLRNGGEMEPKKVFAGFEKNPYEAEARQRWGDDVIDASHRRMQGWSDDDAEKARTGYGKVHAGLAPLLAEGVEVTDPRVQELVQLHYDVTCLFWTPTKEAYEGLGQMYVDDERFRASIGGGDDSLVEYLRDAMHVYAAANLK